MMKIRFLCIIIVLLAIVLPVAATEEPTRVYIDIMPGSCPNALNTEEDITVAIIGTSSFDVQWIDPESVRLNGIAPIFSDPDPIDVTTPFTGELCGCHDLNGDGILDLVLHFDAMAFAGTLSGGEPERVMVTGSITGGGSIIGFDCVVRNVSVPEFPSIALPLITIIGLLVGVVAVRRIR